MKSIFTLASALMLFPAFMQAENLIVIESDNNAIVYDVADNQRLYQRYFGKKLKNPKDYSQIPNGPEAIITHGMEDYYEPALHINHPDGNQSTLLQYQKHETSKTVVTPWYSHSTFTPATSRASSSRRPT